MAAAASAIDLGVRRVDVDREHDERSVVGRDARSLTIREFRRVVRGDHFALDEQPKERQAEVRREREEAVHRLEPAQIDADHSTKLEAERR